MNNAAGYETYQALKTFTQADIDNLQKMFYKNGYVLHIDHKKQTVYTTLRNEAKNLDDTLNNFKLIL